MQRTLRDAFGKETRSDCLVQVYVVGADDGGKANPARRTATDPLPAHSIVLAAHSKRLESQLDNPGWSNAATTTGTVQRKRGTLPTAVGGGEDEGEGQGEGHGKGGSALVGDMPTHTFFEMPWCSRVEQRW